MVATRVAGAGLPERVDARLFAPRATLCNGRLRGPAALSEPRPAAAAAALPCPATDPDWPVDQARRGSLVQRGDQIKRLACGIEPGGVTPAAARHDIAARRQYRGNALGLPVGALGDPDFAWHDRVPVEPLATALLAHRKEGEALGRQVEGAGTRHMLLAIRRNLEAA